MIDKLNHLKAAVVVGALMVWVTSAAAQETNTTALDIPFELGLGNELFQNNCGKCHGVSLQGTNQGPPLLHDFYKPSHHGDPAFYHAMRVGSKQHHWNFGDMPPVSGVDEVQARAIVEFVRWYQHQAGLF